ncbi:hypothetical protein CNMCM8980_001250 [Aspergillus fumigatiaffinis]|uniref:RNA polymerase Rpb1 C-terminal repeat domain-containing protein n=1 Tax=Aspergillus fumigatiaffinis TaxID=340414 RepID=A0A8H4MBW2_9EURO|nr:hypothetical protein CNMCM5878_001320 [Aspergillus fumigatiaffinis]KAF4236700.1 hypothetical protein CNMCM6457_002070 [Aspergillus fumigatiaffinis]KAF4241945.1 hypothetical protein CNMCM6805_003482 [Aspergillus fumigatiaffinis]KAF4250364.1 hypothetical protein CNMCM8980_001250 [Aspergillus fumigatiaffinis]
MAGSGKKSKGKPGGKQKNKKGKTQEASENPSETPSTEQQDQQPQPEVDSEPPFDQEDQQLQAVVEAEPQPAESQAVESNVPLQSLPEPGPKHGQAPEQVPELEHPQPVAATASAVTENWEDPQPSTNLEQEDISSQPQTLNDVQNTFEATHESILEELAAPDPPTEAVETNPEPNHGLSGQSDAAEPPEPTPVTAPQTPMFPEAAAACPLPSPSPTETEYVAASPRSNAASPAPNPSSEAEAKAEVDLPDPQQELSPTADQAISPAPEPASSSRPLSPAPLAASTEPPAFSSVFQTAFPASEAASAALHSASTVNQPASPTFHTASPASKPSSPIPQSASSHYRGASPVMANPASPAQRYASKPASPHAKASSPLTRPYMSPAVSPHATPFGPPPPAPSVPHSIAPSYATAYQSPAMSSAGYMPHYAPYYHHPSPNMRPTPRGSIDPHYASAFQAIRDMGLPNGHGVNDRGTISPPQDQHDEPIELLQRIQEAIPDINRLLDGYKNTKGKLAAREAEFKQMESQHEQALMHKDFYIEALQNQMRKAANESAEEATKLKNTINELRMELGNLEEKRKDIEESLAEAEKSNQELLQTKSELEGQIAALNTNIKEAQEEHEQELERQKEERAEALANQKQELTELFEEIKAEDEKAAAEALAAREKELLDQQETMKAEYEKEKQQLQEKHNSLQSEFDSKVTELGSKEAELASTKEELDSKATALESAKIELDAKVAELESTQTELNSTKDALDEKQKELNQKEQQWTEERTELEARISTKCEELANCERENKKLEEDNLLKEQQLEHAVEGMRTTIDNLGKDCDRLRKTLHSLGEATDLKSTKGDSFFLDCFDQLSRLIVSLSKEHFTYLPIDPPKDILSKIPPELPSFLDNTPASRELRSAYVQHVISKTLTYRIFQPFLFTLGRRYDKADTFFQMLSMDIRRKSVRREAFWRQQTLKAAYTTSDAKQSINVVAAVIVDEIIDLIKHFADPRHLDSLLIGVRKIVKLAAETWRLARVERELIIASLPAPDAEGVFNDSWDEYLAPKEGSVSSGNDPSRHVILRSFPQITREAAHEDFAEDEEKASPCTYSRGTVLYSDSPVVMARLQELAKKSTETLASGEDSPRRGSRGSLRSVEVTAH